MDNITALNVAPSYGSGNSLHTRTDPVTAVIALITAIVGLITAGLNIINAVVGALPPPKDPPRDVGPPWTLWISTGYQNVSLPGGEPPLQGPGGTFPTVLAFDASGSYIGTNYDETKYAYKNGWNALHVWPMSEDIVAQPEYVLLSFPSLFDPVCVIELGMSKNADVNPAGHGGFNALTAKACGQPWYHSGSNEQWVYGDDPKKLPDGMPCVWLGGHGTGSAQFHLPSHSLVQQPDVVQRINRTAETRHDNYCNTPAKMVYWGDTPERSDLRKRLNIDLGKTGDITLEETLQKCKGKKFAGQPDPDDQNPGLQRREDHKSILSIAKTGRPGLLAEELCTHGTSWGPDWVNEGEGKFCDMETHTLWDVCNENLQDNCFDLNLKDVVRGGVLKRSMPYSEEAYYD